MKMAALIVLACASAAFAAEEKIPFTLSGVPSMSLSDTWQNHLVDSLRGTPPVLRKKTSHTFLRQPTDTPDSAMRLQSLRFNATATGNLLPALNPEVWKRNSR